MRQAYDYWQDQPGNCAIELAYGYAEPRAGRVKTGLPGRSSCTCRCCIIQSAQRAPVVVDHTSNLRYRTSDECTRHPQIRFAFGWCVRRKKTKRASITIPRIKIRTFLLAGRRRHYKYDESMLITARNQREIRQRVKKRMNICARSAAYRDACFHNYSVSLLHACFHIVCRPYIILQ